jgi:hypothetical protein
MDNPSLKACEAVMVWRLERWCRSLNSAAFSNGELKLWMSNEIDQVAMNGCLITLSIGSNFFKTQVSETVNKAAQKER